MIPLETIFISNCFKNVFCLCCLLLGPSLNQPQTLCNPPNWKINLPGEIKSTFMTRLGQPRNKSWFYPAWPGQKVTLFSAKERKLRISWLNNTSREKKLLSLDFFFSIVFSTLWRICVSKTIKKEKSRLKNFLTF